MDHPSLVDRLMRFGAALVSAFLLFAAGEPLGWGWLAWFALVPLFWAVLSEKRRVVAWLYGLVFAFVFFGVHLSWIFLFGWMAWTALTVVLALYLSLASLAANIVRKFPLAPALAAGAWTAVELVRDRWPVGGYPWGTVGTTQVSFAPSRMIAPAVGAYGLTFLVVFVAALVADRLVAGTWSYGSMAIVVSALVAFVAVDAVAFRPAPGRAVRMLVVQGGVPRPPRPDQRDAILDSHVRLTRATFARIRRRLPDVIVWPEEAIGAGARSTAVQETAYLALELHTPIVAGVTRLDERGAFLNTVVSFTAAGDVDGSYVKRHPVPFGEYVPIGFFRRFVSTLNDEIPVDMRPGKRAVVFDVGPRHLRIATPICFESVFPRDIRDFTRKGAEIVVVSTNNASFEHSYAAQQHLAHARLRAVEDRQWMVQAGLAGLSAELTPDGRVLHTTRLFERRAFVVDVRARRASSLFSRVGDLFPALFGSLAVAAIGAWLAALVGGRLRRRRY